ncbi:hypothetical protein BC940DRAFT_315546 [Gongronella butleri]|nr:hypothetical protein BC940DRAFT_315546 [Gongronella butleri]
MTPNGIKDPLPEGPIFQVENIPYWVTNEHLYQLFRPFGAIRLCKILVEKNGAFEGTALLQYFSLKHANQAKASMNQRSLDGNMPLKIFALVSTKAPNQLKQQQVGKPDTMIDYTNLYIKNLDLAVKSLDLFSAFREYGRIISARVMKDPVTKQSRGYGFVSFSHAQEAKQALEQLNGQYILSKQVVIAYHEPKKKKQGSGTGHEATSSPSSSPSPGLDVVHDASPSAIKEMASPGNLDAYTEVTASMESTSQRQLQFDRVRTAIVKALKGVGEEPASLTQLAEWVEVIMALRPTSRALCLFNPSYLLTKLEEAASNSSSSSPKPRTPNLVYSSTPPPQHTRDWIPQQPPVTNSVSTTTIHPSLSTTTTTATIAAITGSCTGAAARNTHITTSNSSSVTTASSGIKTDIIHMHDTDTQVTIDRFVQSIKNLSILQQKQHLGDMLFPHVKATGVKHAPKVTIQLLDTQPLDQLAHAMRSMESLKPLVDRAFNQITMQQKFRNAIMQI